MIFLHLELFENKRRFLDISKTVFLRSNPFRKVICLQGHDILIFKILAPFHIQKNF